MSNKYHSFWDNDTSQCWSHPSQRIVLATDHVFLSFLSTKRKSLHPQSFWQLLRQFYNPPSPTSTPSTNSQDLSTSSRSVQGFLGSPKASLRVPALAVHSAMVPSVMLSPPSSGVGTSTCRDAGSLAWSYGFFRWPESDWSSTEIGILGSVWWIFWWFFFSGKTAIPVIANVMFRNRFMA